MSKLTYVAGDATSPLAPEGVTVYGPHCCNDAGGWGSGYVNAITARWGDSPRGMYKLWHQGANSEKINERITERNNPTDGKLLTQTRFVLGGTQFIELPNNYILVNMIGQHNYNPKGEPSERFRNGNVAEAFDRPPVRYGAMAKAMDAVRSIIINRRDELGEKAEIHCCKFGSDLAGGDWNVIEALIMEYWVDSGIPVTVYEWVKP